MKLRPRKAEFLVEHPSQLEPARIISDAAIAGTGIANGRLVPLVIIDTTSREDVRELIRVHKYLPSGDVTCQWGRRRGAKSDITSLFLRFRRPASVPLVIDFDIVGQGVIVDQILISQALYIQAGINGDRFSTTVNAPRIMIEVGNMEFQPHWDEMFRRALTKDFRSRGLTRQQSKQAAMESITQWREFGRFRMPGG